MATQRQRRKSTLRCTPACFERSTSSVPIGQRFPTWGVGTPWGVRCNSRGCQIRFRKVIQKFEIWFPATIVAERKWMALHSSAICENWDSPLSTKDKITSLAIFHVNCKTNQKSDRIIHTKAPFLNFGRCFHGMTNIALFCDRIHSWGVSSLGVRLGTQIVRSIST